MDKRELEKAVKNIEDTPDKPKKEKDTTIYTSFLETEDYILEQIKNATSATDATRAKETYVKYDKAKDTHTFTDIVEH